MIERIDHLVAVVADFPAARRLWIEAGCPVVWDGQIGQHRSCCVSIGAINLELVSEEVLGGWPALARWAEWTPRRFGLHAAALDPGDLEVTSAELRSIGVEATEPREGGLTLRDDSAELVAPRWRNSLAGSLPALLPGLPSFLCEFLEPPRGLGRTARDSPVHFVEARVGVDDPASVALTYERVLGRSPIPDGPCMLFRLGDTSIRLVRGREWEALVEIRPGSTLEGLTGAIPGITWIRKRS